MLDLLDRHGATLVHSVFDAERIAGVRTALAAADGGRTHQRSGGTYAIRNLLRVVPHCRSLGSAGEIRALVESVLGKSAFVTRATLFDKIPSANWPVAWHQDTTIAVAEQREVPGFGPWSLKEGVVHVRPPASVLERILTVRVHLDDCGAGNGALNVIRGTHRFGVLDAATIGRLTATSKAECCDAATGDVLLMRPLLLHASSPSQRPTHRRVLHLEFAAEELPGGLCWHVA